MGSIKTSSITGKGGVNSNELLIVGSVSVNGIDISSGLGGSGAPSYSGTSTQFLKGDGTLDNGVYLTQSAISTKADLINGRVPLVQLPTKTISTTVPSGIPSDGDEWIIYLNNNIT